MAGHVQRTGWVLAALGIAAITMPDVAAQSEPPRGVTVLERSRPDYEPRGVRLGTFILSPDAELRQIFDSNVFAEPDNEESDLATVVEPSVSLSSNWSRHEVGAGAFVALTRFADNNSEDSDEYGADAFARLDLSPRTALLGRVDYERRTEGRDDPEADAGRADRAEFDISTGLAAFNYDFNRLSFQFVGIATRYDFVDRQDDDRERTEFRLAPRVSTEVSPGVVAFAEPFFEIRDYDVTGDRPGEFNRDAESLGATAGAVLDIDGIWAGEIGLGAFNTDFEDDQFDDVSGLIISGAVDWNVTALTTITFDADRRDVASIQDGASSRIRTALGVGVQHELQRNVILTGDLRYREDDFQGIERVDDTVEAEVGAEYLINRNLSVFGEVIYERRDSNDADRDFDRQEVLVGVRGRL